MTTVELQDVHVTYGNSNVVTGLSFTVAPGRWLALVGPNGSGKTSALRAICGLVPYQGVIRLAQRPTQQLSARAVARMVALVPQHPTLPAGMTVATYVLLGRTPHLSYFAHEGATDRQLALEACDRLEITHLLDRDVSTLSGGEQQLAVLARALTQQASVLLLDEPTSALDLGHQQHVLATIDRLRLSSNVTVIAALHDLTHAGQYADSVALLSAGRLAAHGSPKQVLTATNIAAHYGASVHVRMGSDDRVTITMKRQED